MDDAQQQEHGREGARVVQDIGGSLNKMYPKADLIMRNSTGSHDAIMEAISDSLSTIKDREEMRAYCVSSIRLYCTSMAETGHTNSHTVTSKLNTFLAGTFELLADETREEMVTELLRDCTDLWVPSNDWLFANGFLMCALDMVARGLLETDFAKELGGQNRILQDLIPGVLGRIGRVWTDQKLARRHTPKDSMNILQKRVITTAFALGRKYIIINDEWMDQVFAAPKDGDSAGLLSFMLNWAVAERESHPIYAWVPELERRMMELASRSCLIHDKFDLKLFVRWLKVQEIPPGVERNTHMEDILLQMLLTSSLVMGLQTDNWPEQVARNITFEELIQPSGRETRRRGSLWSEGSEGIDFVREDLDSVLPYFRTQTARDILMRAELINQRSRCARHQDDSRPCLFGSVWSVLVADAFREGGRASVESLLDPIVKLGSIRFQTFIESLVKDWDYRFLVKYSAAESLFTQMVICPAITVGQPNAKLGRLLLITFRRTLLFGRPFSIETKQTIMLLLATSFPLLKGQLEDIADRTLLDLGRAKFPEGAKVKRTYESILALSSVHVVPRLRKQPPIRQVWLPPELIRRLWTFFILPTE